MLERTFDQLLRKAILALTLAVLAGTHLSRAQGDQLPVGAELPLQEREMENANGDPMSLSDAAGTSGLVIIFWSNICPWVGKYESRVLDLVQTYGEAGIKFVLVNANDQTSFPDESFASSESHAESMNYEVPYLMDANSELATEMGAERDPEAFFFGRDLRLVYAGTIDDSPGDTAAVTETYLEDAIDAYLAGESIDPQRTKPFGCTIKFSRTSTDAEDVSAVRDRLGPIYPNPFGSAATVPFSTSASGRVTVRVHDMLGRLVGTLVDEVRSQGNYAVHFDGSALAPGVYFCTLELGSYRATRQLVRLSQE